jgi:hypothetical protein
MKDQASPDSKADKPHRHFTKPGDVVGDAALDAQHKAKALDNLEQDARQLAEASSEGMAGGEPARLQEVLEAKAALASESPKTLNSENAQRAWVPLAWLRRRFGLTR